MIARTRFGPDWVDKSKQFISVKNVVPPGIPEDVAGWSTCLVDDLDSLERCVRPYGGQFEHLMVSPKCLYDMVRGHKVA
jgi:hypothetical protein